MNGIHDLGGMQGFGPIEREENEPVGRAYDQLTSTA
jgi:nitrile hydratase subunit beta